MTALKQFCICVVAALLMAGCSKTGLTEAGHFQAIDSEQLGNGPDAAPASSTPLPGGRAYYVVTVMGGANYTQTFGRICQLTFTTSGTVNMSYRNWSFTFPGEGQHNVWKKATGYTTTGCVTGGVVKTPAGFQPPAQGGSWLTTSGAYYYNTTVIPGQTVLVINWSSGQQEIWKMTHNPGGMAYTRLDLYSSSNLKHGYGFGSTKNFDTAVNMSAIKSFGTMPMAGWSNNWVTNDFYFSTTFTSAYFNVCSGNTNVMVGPLATNACDRYHNYLAGNPATDKRKVYWNHQLGSVGCSESGVNCTTNPTGCTQWVLGPGGGHTSALLQVIDDNGNFKGFVGTEASLSSHVYGNSVISCFVAYKFE